MEYAVEWFSPSIGTPIVSLAEYGIVFNRAAIAALNSPYAIRVGFDRENKLIIVRGLDETQVTSDTFPFAERERNGFVRINNKDLVRFIIRYCPELKTDKAIRFLARMDNDLLIIDLNAPADSGDDQMDE